ncbi:MAG: tRNA-dihydrouridine synthase [Candidatus Thermoplasmatota archaeon]|nr:tRNA-dihydrouridine synthase [Candidatus Thermoplasmatota archaeon]
MKPSRFVKILREKRLLLPPLSGYTDYPYRVILAKFHPHFLMTEMANARAILQKNRRTMQILRIVEGNHYNGVQLVGSIPEYMRKAAQIVQDLGFDYIDINMGCTARKVASRGEGIALMKNETRASEIVTAITSAVEVPVTCKMRLGASKRSMNVTSLSKKLVDAGATALTIHGRSGEKKFGVLLDFSLIKEAAQILSVPVIANGSIYTGADAQKILQKTGAAGIMPGRGLLGNPWLIPEICTTLSHQRYSSPPLQEKKKICLEHLDLLVEFYGERRAVLKMRSILPHYFSSCVFLKDLKKDVQRVTGIGEISILLEKIQEEGINFVYRKSMGCCSAIS